MKNSKIENFKSQFSSKFIAKLKSVAGFFSLNNGNFDRVVSCFFLTIFAFLLFCDTSFATTTTTDVEKVLCRFYELLTGNAGKVVAAFAVFFIGISLFMGKVSWGLAISTAMGIAAMFGAATIVSALSDGDTLDCADVLDDA